MTTTEDGTQEFRHKKTLDKMRLRRYAIRSTVLDHHSAWGKSICNGRIKGQHWDMSYH
jgi:hypothetical protein